jgi:hypothetical protein
MILKMGQPQIISAKVSEQKISSSSSSSLFTHTHIQVQEEEFYKKNILHSD